VAPSDLEAHLARLSRSPGVYLFKDAAGEVLYVGKAKRLRDRVRSYFAASASHGLKTRELVRRIRDLDTIVVGSEAEALILESNLIKEHRPRFNVQLRDDKRYPYIKVTLQEPFPRVFVTRKVRNDGARYFGPYTSVGKMRSALDIVKRIYTVRSCRYRLPTEAPARACLDYHIGRCKAPCVGLQSESDYRGMIDEIVAILGGDIEGVRARLEQAMREAAGAQAFETAAGLRDAIQGLDALARAQHVERQGGGDLDVLAVARDGATGVGIVLRIRDGLLLGRDALRFTDLGDESEAELLAAFAARYYLGRGSEGTRELPREMLVRTDFDDRPVLEEALTSVAGRRVTLVVPRRGEKARLLELAETNAHHALEDRLEGTTSAAERADDTLYDLQDKLDLKVVPRLMVCFDISHTQGTETVASAVVFENGEPRKSDYRRMKIRGEWGNDDYASMHEAVGRWFARRRDEGRPLPDLCLIDGGRGQLGSAQQALNELGLGDVAVASLAKREEEVFLPGREQSIRLDRRDRALHVLQRIRNEAHRFAITYNRKLRKRRTIRSELEDIPGVGPSRRQALLERFGSVRGIREARPDELSRVPGVSETLAHRILTYLGS
jgi:excinuclease ABC subunit C